MGIHFRQLSRKKCPGDDLSFYGLKNATPADKVCAFLLAICPLIQHYIGIYNNAGFTILILLMPYLGLRLISAFKRRKINRPCGIAFLLLMLFQVYKMLSHGFGATKILYGVFMIIVFLAVAYGCISVEYLFKYASTIACAAGCLLLLQYVLFYGLGIHLQLVATKLLLPESSSWILLAQTGLYDVTGKPIDMYRPSAFFLEPSHLMIYCFPILCIYLLSPDINRTRFTKAIIVSAALLLSTSGMGIGILGIIWVVFLVMYYNGKDNRNVASIDNVFSKKTALLAVAVAALAVVVVTQVDFVRNAIIRIFVSKDGQSTAIDGRIRLAKDLVSGLRGSALCFGETDDISNITFNLSGFFSTFYKHGIFGLILSYLFYFYTLFKLKGGYFWISLIIIVISYFTAHTHGTFYMLYYVILLMGGFYSVRHYVE